MEDTLKLLKQLADQGVDVILKDDNLKLIGEKGSLREDLITAVRVQKNSIIEHLRLTELSSSVTQKIEVTKFPPFPLL